MQLRERQIEAIHGGEFGPGILKCWDPEFAGLDATGTEITGGQSTLVVAATGFGKTVLFGAVAHLHLTEGSGRVMLLTHRDKLLWQSQATFEAFGHQCDVEMGEYRADNSVMFSRNIVLMTVQTARSGRNEKRYEKFNPEEFGLVIVDEAHHAVSNEFLQVINHFKKNPNCKILGVTATPDRHDMQALKHAFDSVAYAYGLQRAINDGWLCPIEVQFHELQDYDLSNVRARGDDFIQGELENELLKHVAPCAQKLYEATRRGVNPSLLRGNQSGQSDDGRTECDSPRYRGLCYRNYFGRTADANLSVIRSRWPDSVFDKYGRCNGRI